MIQDNEEWLEQFRTYVDGGWAGYVWEVCDCLTVGGHPAVTSRVTGFLAGHVDVTKERSFMYLNMQT